LRYLALFNITNLILENMISFKKLKLSTKMLVLVIFTGTLVIAMLGISVGYKIRQMAVNGAVASVTLEAEKQAALIQADLEGDLGFTRAMAQSMGTFPKLARSQRDSIYLDILHNVKKKNSKYLYTWMSWEYSALIPGYTKDYGRIATTVYEDHGDILNNVEYKDTAGNVLTSSYYKIKKENNEAILDPYPYSINKGPEILLTSICTPINNGNKFAGLVGVDIALSKFQEMIAGIKSFEGTVAFLISTDGTIIAHTDPSLVGKKIVEVYPDITTEYKLDKRIAEGFGAEFFSETNDRNDYTVLRPIKVGAAKQPWSLGLFVPVDEIMRPATNLLYFSFFVIIFGLGVLGFVVWLIARNIINPLLSIRDLLNIMAKGDIDADKKVAITTGDELEELGNSLNNLIDGLNNAEVFAREIGKGNLDAEFNLLGPQDLLGQSLLSMRSSLKEAKEHEFIRRKEEEVQVWITAGQALFGEILRHNNDNIEELSYEIIQNLVTYLGANQGGIFVVNDTDTQHPLIEMTACYAYDRRKFMQKTVELGEGMIGRCFQEKKRIYMTKVPNNYISITSGLGQENPTALLLIPMMVNETIYGVIEIASFSEFPEHHISFTEKVSESIAATISTAKINIRTAELLAKAQQQAEELAAQEEEMRQNIEELQSIQEEAERKRHEQEMLKEEMRNEKELLDALMQNIPDFVYFKDANSRFIRISKSMVKLFQANSPEELIGKSDFDFHAADHAQIAFKEEKDIMNTRNPIIDHVVHEQFDDGREQWVSTTKMPLFDDTGEVVGVWGISKIVTDLKQAEIVANSKAEEAEALRKKIEAKENEYKALAVAIDAKTLVIQYTTNGIIISANTSMLSIIGKSSAEVIGRHQSEFFESTDSEGAQKELWSDLMRGIVVNRRFKGKVNGKKIVINETYSPVINSEGVVEKVICISVKEI